MANSLILAKARNAVTAHDWTTAARLYKELLRGDESNAEYIQQLGSIFVRAGQDEKAIPYYEKLVEMNPESPDAMISLGAIFRRLKRYEDSVNILHKAQEISSGSPTINYNLGFTYKEMGDYDDAIDSFESVIAQNPDDVLAHNHLGSIYFSKKEYDKSVSAYKKGLQVDQNHPILNYNLAHVYEEIKNYPDAVRSYEVALKTRPGWLDAIRDFSELLIHCQETKQAQELVEQSIKLHPDDVELLCILGRIYLNQFDYDNATKTYRRAETLRQNDIGILVGLSKSLEKGMKIDEAMDKILDAVDIAPEDLDVCKQYAHVLLSAQRYEKALDLIQKIDEKSGGKDLQILDLYGQYFVCRGDEEAANTYFDKIRRINHHYKDYMVNAASRYIQTGDYEKAEAMAEKFIDSRPKLPEGYNLLGTINSKRGQLNKAKAEFEKGISLKNPNIYAVKELEKIYSELEANKEIFNTEEMPIAIDADKLSAEEGGNLPGDSSLSADDNGTADQLDALNTNSEEKDNLDDIQSLEVQPPIEQALAGEDGDFWEDFDDDPDAQNKPITEEDDTYDENSEDTDLLSMMTPDAADEATSLKDGLTEDESGFDFSEFEDGRIEEPASQASAEETPAGDTSDTPAETKPAAVTESAPVSAPAQSVAAPQSTPDMEPAPGTAPEASPVVEPVAVEPDFTNNEASQMMQELKQQQKELELQQREFALQQKEFAEELKQENEKMIVETVSKTVDEKLSEYDLRSEPAKESVEEADLAEELEPNEEFMPEIPSEELHFDSLSHNQTPMDESEIELYDDDFTDVGFGDELTEEEVSMAESEEILAEEAQLDGMPPSEIESEPMMNEDFDDVKFACVTDFIKEEAAVPLSDEPFADVTNVVNLNEPAEIPETADSSSEESFITADDMLDKIERILNDDDYAKSCEAELELFKRLRTLSNFLPEREKNSFDCCRMRMVIEYIISKMSGKPGLLITAESLIKSGVLGEEYNRQLEDSSDEELSNDLICHVIKDMKTLAQGLEDKYLCTALCVSADGILEQIALRNQKSAIFE